MSDRPHILVVNDDGVDSPGIAAAARALRSMGNVTVVAPDGDRSGIGHAISIRVPVSVATVDGRDCPTYRCSGAPADCVVLGTHELCSERPALVVSGINRGGNLGDDVNYSGTVAAAIEGVISGSPAIAISLVVSWPEQASVHHWQTAGAVLIDAACDILKNGLPPLTFLNINVPNVAAEELRGVRWTRQGRKLYHDRTYPGTDPRGGSYYWIWGSFDAGQIEDDTDLAAVRQGYASISPLSVDRTDHALLAARRLAAGAGTA